MVEIWVGRKELVIMNYYNTSKRMELIKLEEIEGQSRASIVWFGNFNAHNILWGSEKTDSNGQVIEDLLNEKNLVC